MEKLYTVDEVAEAFQVSTDIVRRLCARREWPHVRVGRATRFSEDNVSEILEIQGVKVSEERRRVNDLMARTGLTLRGAERHIRDNPRR